MYEYVNISEVADSKFSVRGKRFLAILWGNAIFLQMHDHFGSHIGFVDNGFTR